MCLMRIVTASKCVPRMHGNNRIRFSLTTRNSSMGKQTILNMDTNHNTVLLDLQCKFSSPKMGWEKGNHFARRRQDGV